MLLNSMTACQVAQALVTLLPLELQVALLETHAKRLNISVAINFKDGVPISADHRWHQDLKGGNGKGPRTEHPDMSGG